MSEDTRQRLMQLMGKLSTIHDTNKLERIFHRMPSNNPEDKAPYEWQAEFCNAGSKYVERALVSANQVGKNFVGGAEVACHLTGMYPPWWTGRRFAKGIDVMVAGITAQFVRDTTQTDLVGEWDHERGSFRGNGWLPAHTLGQFSFRVCGVQQALDYIKVRRHNGEWSTCYFMAYEQGTTKYQGFKRDLAWLDEEPEDTVDQRGIYSETLIRLAARNGIMLFTRTPLFGYSPVIKHFMDGGNGIWYKTVTWDDAYHLSPDRKEQLINSMPEHERDTRTRGMPMMGSGSVYSVKDSEIVVKPFEIPAHWRRVCGIDFGMDHPAAGAWLAFDADSDVVYLYDCYKQSNQTPIYHAHAINQRGSWIPVAWPHDGTHRGKADGIPLAQQYRDSDVNMMAISARYDDESGGGQSVEPIVMMLLERMKTGRFKVFSTCQDWLEEKRMYHRKDGKIVKERDDLISASHYALMMLRYAITPVEANKPRPAMATMDYDPLGTFIRN